MNNIGVFSNLPNIDLCPLLWGSIYDLIYGYINDRGPLNLFKTYTTYHKSAKEANEVKNAEEQKFMEEYFSTSVVKYFFPEYYPEGTPWKSCWWKFSSSEPLATDANAEKNPSRVLPLPNQRTTSLTLLSNNQNVESMFLPD